MLKSPTSNLSEKSSVNYTEVSEKFSLPGCYSPASTLVFGTLCALTVIPVHPGRYSVHTMLANYRALLNSERWQNVPHMWDKHSWTQKCTSILSFETNEGTRKQILLSSSPQFKSVTRQLDLMTPFSTWSKSLPTFHLYRFIKKQLTTFQRAGQTTPLDNRKT